jgi:hypothetical protein
VDLRRSAVALSSEQRTLVGRAGAHALHAQYDSRELTANARAAWFATFLKQVDEATPGLEEDERLRRAEHLMRSYMAKLALRSSIARSKRVVGDAG